jgi:hypothetical protein
MSPLSGCRDSSDPGLRANCHSNHNENNNIQPGVGEKRNPLVGYANKGDRSCEYGKDNIAESDDAGLGNRFHGLSSFAVHLLLDNVNINPCQRKTPLPGGEF